MISWTAPLRALTARDLQARARAVVDNVPADLLARTAAFLLLKDSKSSFAIENEHPPHDRIQRWGRAIGEAGRRPIDLDELLRLQRIVIGDDRFVQFGLREEGGFVGEHDRETRMPLPDISAPGLRICDPLSTADRVRPGRRPHSIRSSRPRRSRSASSTSILSRTATAGCTAILFIMSWRNADSIRPVLCSRFRRRSSTVSTITGACSKAIRRVFCR